MSTSDSDVCLLKTRWSAGSFPPACMDLLGSLHVIGRWISFEAMCKDPTHNFAGVHVNMAV